MELLQNKKIKLRALEPEDLEFLFAVENDERFWEVSSTLTPFSKDLLKHYLSNSHQDICEAKQLRLVIVDATNNINIGLIDLFDFNPQHRRAGIGILVLKDYQNKGYASEALQLFINYAFKKLNLHQIFANIPNNNTNSITLFQKMNFKCIGIKKDWLLTHGKYNDVNLYQLINS
ncbi:MAG: GNAT family N-acetyltransferase [Flavobacteriaceae bacterium]|nr:GNAT family N-acetyltransferase [Flavobacteriaceae bacterium]